MTEGNHKPIGIFDSGIGGLTVAHAIAEILPNEQIIYFGDTAHLPYGDKSPSAIRHYSEKITEFLIEKNCKAVVIACNTASAHAFDHLMERFDSKLPIVNVIEPVVSHIAQNHSHKKIGVIGTKGTIRSGIYNNKIKNILPKASVVSMETGLLAFMIEEGFVNDDVSKMVIDKYLSSEEMKDIDSLILGCTHYPLIKNEIEAFYDGSVDVIDSASVVAEYFKSLLEVNSLLASARIADHQFFVSDHSDFFEQTANVFFHAPVHLELKNIWEE